MRRPNILFLLSDQHRPDFMSGDPRYPVRTPVLDRLAARGLRFERATTPAPVCAPARACLATASDYGRCAVSDNDVDLPLDEQTYYQRLRAAGYRVAGVGKFDLHKATLDWGLDGKRSLDEWGFTDGIDSEGKWDAMWSGRESPKGPYMAYLYEEGLAREHIQDFMGHRRPKQRMAGSLPDEIPLAYAYTAPTPLPQEAYGDNWVAGNALATLEQIPLGQPWHLVVNFQGPHDPVDVTQEMWERWQGAQFAGPRPHHSGTQEQHVAIRRNYAAMIENIDRLCGEIIAAVDRRGELGDTLVVYASDHGEMLGDHGRWAKSVWFRQSVGVPLVVAGPGVAARGTSLCLAQLQDLAATFVELAGAEPLPDRGARSLVPVLAARQQSVRRVATAGLRDWRMAWDGRWKVVTFRDRDPLLWDLEEDPYEERDVAAEQPEIVAALASHIPR